MVEITHFQFHESLIKALSELNYQQATDVQSVAIPSIMAGSDLMVSAKTGSGKTAAFLLPILQHYVSNPKKEGGTRGLILVPTRELAIQIDKVFAKLAKFTYVKAGLVIGGEPFKYQIATIRKNPELLIATPGRLVEHIENGHTDFSELEHLVLDEADRMLDMGFVEAMKTIGEACSVERQTLLFSATLKHKGLNQVKALLREPKSIVIDELTDTHINIEQQIILADDDRHKERLIVALVKEEVPDKVMVFCKTRAQCQKVSNLLRAQKMDADFLHGEIAQSERKQVLNRFRDGKIKVLVCTDVAARGLDIDGVDLVVNYTMAQSGDEHVHRVGRTGRSGEKGVAVSLINALDWNLMSSIERYLKLRFAVRQIAGMKAEYSGPKKLKKSGKAAGSKKRPVNPWRDAGGKNKSKKPTGKKKTVNKAATGQSNTTLSNASGPTKSAPRKASPVKPKRNDQAGFEVFKPKKK